MAANYESGILEFAKQFPDTMKIAADSLRVLYPEPTVWSDHPIIALDEGGRRFLEAMRDPEIQEIAWREHGFRTAIPGIINDLGVYTEVSIPDVVQAMPLPAPNVLFDVNAVLQSANCNP